MELIDIIKYGNEHKASDIHLTVGVPPTFRINGTLKQCDDKRLNHTDLNNLVEKMLDKEQLDFLNKKGEVDTSFSAHGLGRFRVNIYKQRGSCGVALRTIPIEIPTPDVLGLPKVISDLSRKPRGLILVTGPTGSGKSTTLASMIDQINRERSCHILTLEDPIEYLHEHKKSIVNQREIGADSQSFSDALRAALRQDPDVILVGEMRDLETISIALTAAETGHLVLSTLHTSGASKTIDRVIDVFPSYQQKQIRIQFASVIQGIIFQQLLEKIDGSGRVGAFEIMVATPAIRNLIREEKSYQIDTAIQTGAKYGMKTMDDSIAEIYKKGLISKETALSKSFNVEQLKKIFSLGW